MIKGPTPSLFTNLFLGGVAGLPNFLEMSKLLSFFIFKFLELLDHDILFVGQIIRTRIRVYGINPDGLNVFLVYFVGANTAGLWQLLTMEILDINMLNRLFSRGFVYTIVFVKLGTFEILSQLLFNDTGSLLLLVIQSLNQVMGEWVCRNVVGCRKHRWSHPATRHFTRIFCWRWLGFVWVEKSESSTSLWGEWRLFFLSCRNFENSLTSNWGPKLVTISIIGSL